ncbi:MAG: SMI1/KNR4 family protein [Anaerolineae bacterium]|nr:SMI1/KNR4 family protein [Anaerolineae bacterium]
MVIQITQSLAALSQIQLQLFQNENKIKLPKDYKGFLLKNNGGKPKPNAFKVDANIGEDEVRFFFGITNAATEVNINKIIKTYQGRLPANFLPIAAGLGVDLICLSVKGEDYGKIYYWDHNWEITEGVPDYSNVYLLADSFDGFLNKLYE